MSRDDLRVLELLHSGPKSFEDLLATVGLDGERDVPSYLVQLLEALENLGLVAVVSRPDAS